MLTATVLLLRKEGSLSAKKQQTHFSPTPCNVAIPGKVDESWVSPFGGVSFVLYCFSLLGNVPVSIHAFLVGVVWVRAGMMFLFCTDLFKKGSKE